MDGALTFELIETATLAAKGDVAAAHSILRGAADRLEGIPDHQAMHLCGFFNGFAAGLAACNHPCGETLIDLAAVGAESASAARTSLRAVLSCLVDRPPVLTVVSGDAR